MKQNMIFTLAIYCCLLLLTSTTILAQCADTNADTPVTPPENLTFCLNIDDSADFTPSNLPTSEETNTTDYTFVVTSNNNLDDEGNPIIVGLSDDGFVDFNALGVGTYCVSGFAYNQEEVDGVATFLNENPGLAGVVGLPAEALPLPTPLPLTTLLDIAQGVVGDLTITGVLNALGILGSILPTDLCIDISDAPFYCVEVIDDPTVCMGIPGDFCTNSILLEGFSEEEGVTLFYGPFDNTDFTVSPTDPIPPCFFEGTLENTMWFSFTGDGNVYDIRTSAECAGGLNLNEFDLYITDGDTQMAVYTGDCNGNLTEVACNDDSPDATADDLFAEVSIATEDGVTYYMMLDGFNPDNSPSTGSFCFAVSLGEPCTANVDLAPNTPLTFEICSDETAAFDIDVTTLDFGTTNASDVVWYVFNENPMGQNPFEFNTNDNLVGVFLGYPSISPFQITGDGSDATYWVVGILANVDQSSGTFSIDNCTDWTEAVQIINLPDGSPGCPEPIDCTNSNIDLAPDTPETIFVCTDAVDSATVFIDETTLAYGSNQGPDATPAWLVLSMDPESGENALDLALAGDPSFLGISSGAGITLLHQGEADTLWAVATNFPDVNDAGNFVLGECLEFTEVVTIIFIAPEANCPQCNANADVTITPPDPPFFCLGFSSPEDLLITDLPTSEETQTTDFTFAITNQNDLGTNGDPLIVGLTDDGSFDFSNLNPEEYCFHALAYQQADIDAIAQFLNDNPQLAQAIGIVPEALPLPIPLSLATLLEIRQDLIGAISIPIVVDFLELLSVILPAPACFDLSDGPLYCIEVTNDPTLCGFDPCVPNADLDLTPENQVFCQNFSSPNDIALTSIPTSEETGTSGFALLVADMQNALFEEPILLGTTNDGSFDLNDVDLGEYCFYSIAYSQEDLIAGIDFINANESIATGIFQIPADALPLPTTGDISILFELGGNVVNRPIVLSDLLFFVDVFDFLGLPFCYDLSIDEYCVEVTNDVRECGGEPDCVQATIFDAPTCAGTTPNTYSFSIIVAGGSGNQQVIASVGTVSNLGDGIYTIANVAENQSTQITVTDPETAIFGCEPFVLNINAPDCNCNFSAIQTDLTEGETGSVTPFHYNISQIELLGGTPPFTYQWDRTGYVRHRTIPPSQIQVTYAENAMWSVTITDANDCAVVATNDQDDATNGNIGGPLRIYEHTVTSDNCSTAEDDGEIIVEVEGGIPPYRYEWNGPNSWATAPTAPEFGLNRIENLPMGWYGVTVTDSHPTAPTETRGWYWINCQNNPANGGGFIRGKQTLATTALFASPNPFTAQTLVQFTVDNTQTVQLQLYGITGQLVQTLMDGTAQAGQLYQVTLDGAELPRGVYIATLTLESGAKKQYKLVR